MQGPSRRPTMPALQVGLPILVACGCFFLAFHDGVRLGVLPFGVLFIVIAGQRFFRIRQASR